MEMAIEMRRRHTEKYSTAMRYRWRRRRSNDRPSCARRRRRDAADAADGFGGRRQLFVCRSVDCRTVGAVLRRAAHRSVVVGVVGVVGVVVGVVVVVVVVVVVRVVGVGVAAVLVGAAVCRRRPGVVVTSTPSWNADAVLMERQFFFGHRSSSAVAK